MSAFIKSSLTTADTYFLSVMPGTDAAMVVALAALVDEYFHDTPKVVCAWGCVCGGRGGCAQTRRRPCAAVRPLACPPLSPRRGLNPPRSLAATKKTNKQVADD